MRVKTMPFHVWGDEWPHWDELYYAERFIINYVYKYSRCYLSCKEKYGSIRYERVVPVRCKQFTIKMPYFKRKIAGREYDRYLFIWTESYLYRAWTWLGKKVLLRAVRIACEMFPNIREELTCDLDIKYI